jgi:hypothetical protein
MSCLLLLDSVCTGLPLIVPVCSADAWLCLSLLCTHCSAAQAAVNQDSGLQVYAQQQRCRDGEHVLGQHKVYLSVCATCIA